MGSKFDNLIKTVTFMGPGFNNPLIPYSKKFSKDKIKFHKWRYKFMKIISAKKFTSKAGQPGTIVLGVALAVREEL